MRFFTLAAILISSIFLSGCAAKHPNVVQSSMSVTVPQGHGKLVITRNSDMLFMGVPVRIDVNGQRAVELWRGETYAAPISPGRVTLLADAWSTPGKFQTHFNIESNKEYIFEVSPRSEHFSTLAFFGVIGAAIDAAVDENTGPFSLLLKDIQPIK